MYTTAPSLFGSKVGRRIFGLMALSGLLPLIVTLIFTQLAARQELNQTLQGQIRENAQVYSMGVLSALQQHIDEARSIARRLPVQGEKSAFTDAGRYFTAAWQMRDTDKHRTILGDGSLDLSWQSLNHKHLANDQAQLIRDPARPSNSLILVVPANAAGKQKLLAMEIPGESIWRSSSYIPSHATYCIFSASDELVECASTVDESAIATLSEELRSADTSGFEWQWGDRTMMSSASTLFMGATFAAPDLRVVAVLDKETAYKSLNDYQALLPPLLGGVVIVIMLLSVRLVRRNLVPLKNLTAVTKAFAEGKLKTRIRVDRDDEFGELSAAFNDMASRLDQQFDALHTMSGVDDQILSGESIDNIFRHFLREIARLFDLRVSAVCIADPDSDENTLLLIHSENKIFRSRVTLAESLESVVKAGIQEATWVSRSALDPAIDDELRLFHATNVLAVPLSNRSVTRGLVLLCADDKESFDDSSKDLCSKLISRLAMGVASIEREEMLYKKSHFDDLTQLPNRQLLKDRLYQCLTNVSNHGTRGALFFIDLDRFKEVNDVYGHTAGDRLLSEAAARMQSVCDPSYTVARLGGDEFVVLIPEIGNHSHIRSVATAILDTLQRPFQVEGREQVLGASLGISLFPDDGKSVEITLRNADAAMYRAKAAGRGRYEFFSKKMNVANQRRLGLERDLRNAIKLGELELYMQPQVDLAAGYIRGAECLLRWPHPTLGWISPAEFIPIAEDSGLIVDMGRWTVNHACQEWRKMLDDGLEPGTVSINVSGRELEEGTFASQIINALEKQSLSEDTLEIEITESLVARNKDLAIRTLKVLQNIGVTIAMDDFGTGFSSLSFLGQLPLDCIKVDQSFVSAIGTSTEAESLCRTIVSMSHELGKFVVAEGVEHEHHAKFLEKIGCEFAQGFYIAKPMPISEFRDFVLKHQCLAAPNWETA